MRPINTTYTLVRPGGQFNALYAMARRAGGHVHKGDFVFPIVVAKRAGKIIGFVATQPSTEAVIAGPLVVEPPSLITFLRLAEAYENVLRAAGVKVYLHTIDKGREKHVEMMERLGFTRWGETENGDVVMRRDLAWVS